MVISKMSTPRRFLTLPESLDSARIKVNDLAQQLRTRKLNAASDLIKGKIEETLTYYRYPPTHWIRIRTNNPLERIMKEIRRRTRVVGAFPDGHSALMLVAAHLRHIAGTKWGAKIYLSMEPLYKQEFETQATA